MNTVLPSKQTLLGYGLAVFAVCLGVYFNTKLAALEAGEQGLFLLRLFELLAVMAILKATFQWGKRRGFPIRRADGRLHFGNLLSNLVMAGLVIMVLRILCSALIIGVWRFAQ